MMDYYIFTPVFRPKRDGSGQRCIDSAAGGREMETKALWYQRYAP